MDLSFGSRFDQTSTLHNKQLTGYPNNPYISHRSLLNIFISNVREMSLQKPLFTPKPRFTPIPPNVDIPALVHSTPNFHWAHREDARLHSSPFHKLQQIIHSVTIEQGLPIVVDNWHLRQDWNASLFSKEWLVREHGNDSTQSKIEADCRYHRKRLGQGTRYHDVYCFLFVASA